MKIYFSVFCLALLMASCSSSKYSVVTKANDIELQINLKADSKKFPSTPYTSSVPHLMSYSITNLDREKIFYPVGAGGTERAFLLFTFLLSDNTMIEQRAELMAIQQVSPLVSTSEQSLMVNIPKKEKIKDLVSVGLHFDNWLNQTGSSIADLKKHVSLDTGCSINSIEVQDTSEQAGNAIYLLKVCGKDMKYRRIGSVFYKDGENPTKQ